MRKILFYIMIIINLISIIVIYIDMHEEKYINVEIKGEVKFPNAYKVKDGTIVKELIEIAGGLTNDSNISFNNLAKKLKDEDVVIIYSNIEIDELTNDVKSVKYIEKECVCPRIINDSCLSKEYVIDNSDTIISNNKISLNSSTKDELMTLDGIGESKALKIIEYRENNNGFKTLEEIMNIKGIGKSIYEKIKNNITL